MPADSFCEVNITQVGEREREREDKPCGYDQE